MKKLSMTLLADTVIRQRKEKQMTQKQLSELTGINRAMISRLEKQDYQPSIHGRPQRFFCMLLYN